MRAYTIKQYREAFDGRKHGHVLADHEGDLIWTATQPGDVQQAYGSMAVDWPTLNMYQTRMGVDGVLCQLPEFD